MLENDCQKTYVCPPKKYEYKNGKSFSNEGHPSYVGIYKGKQALPKYIAPNIKQKMKDDFPKYNNVKVLYRETQDIHKAEKNYKELYQEDNKCSKNRYNNRKENKEKGI